MTVAPPVKRLTSSGVWMRYASSIAFAVPNGLWMVEFRDSHRPIGICGLIKRDTLADVDLGFAFMPEFRGEGFAQEASEACMRHARDQLGINRVVAIVSPENLRSIALLKKLGFQFETKWRATPDDNVERVSSFILADSGHAVPIFLPGGICPYVSQSSKIGVTSNDQDKIDALIRCFFEAFDNRIFRAE